MIRQGDLYWITLDPSDTSTRRPYVVIQNDAANRSCIATVLLCGLTSQLRLGVNRSIDCWGIRATAR